jgi:hypothetical protein
LKSELEDRVKLGKCQRMKKRTAKA